jgi:hypothetical protein
MDITQDNTKLLEQGDFEKLDKREKEAFHALQEEMIAMLVSKSNHFKTQFPGLRIDWRFQAEVYTSVVNGPSSVRYSNRII